MEPKQQQQQQSSSGDCSRPSSTYAAASNTVNFAELLSSPQAIAPPVATTNTNTTTTTTSKTNMVRSQSESLKNLSTFLSKPQSLMSIFTPPISPLLAAATAAATTTTTTTAAANSAGKFHYEVMSELRPTSSIASYQFRFLGSTRLRHRHTLPMLTWIVADLVNRSKCNGEEMQSKVQECLKDNTKFEELQKKLLRRSNQTGLMVDFVIIGKDTTANAYFQVTNAVEENILFHHSLADIFLFGRFARDSSLFYYVHKDPKEANTVPSLFVYQAGNETQLDDLCTKYGETRTKYRIDNSKHLFHNKNDTNTVNNCFEVLLVGTVAISTKRVSPQVIDKAVTMFAKKRAADKKATKPEPPKRSGSIQSLERPSKFQTKRFIVEVIDENEPLEMNAKEEQVAQQSTSSPPPPKIETSTTLIPNTQSLDFDTRRQLMKEFLHKNTAAAAAEVGRTSPIHVKDIQFTVEDRAVEGHQANEDLAEPEVMYNTVKRLSSDELSLLKHTIALQQLAQTSKEALPAEVDMEFCANKSMLFIIAQMDICLISLENHKTVLSKTFLNITHCSQGKEHVDHFGIIVREPFVPNYYTETYVGHIFKCQTKEVTNELLCALRLAFNNAYRANKLKNSSAGVAAAANAANTNNILFADADAANGAQASYCSNCPMNWFHQLCLDIDGLDDRTILVFLMFRIQQSSPEKRHEFIGILDQLRLETDGQKVDVLMILLKARVERMQRRHELDGCQLNNSMSIYNQFEGEDLKSTASLTKLEGLKLLAKNSLGSIFKVNRGYQHLGEQDKKRHSVHFSSTLQSHRSSEAAAKSPSTISTSLAGRKTLNKAKSLDIGALGSLKEKIVDIVDRYAEEDEDDDDDDDEDEDYDDEEEGAFPYGDCEELEPLNLDNMGNTLSYFKAPVVEDLFDTIDLEQSVDAFMKFHKYKVPFKRGKENVTKTAKMYEQVAQQLPTAKAYYAKVQKKPEYVNAEAENKKPAKKVAHGKYKPITKDDINLVSNFLASNLDATSVQHAYPSIPSMTFATETQAKEQWKYVLDTMNFDPKKDVFQLRAAIAPFLKLGVPKSIKTKVWAFFIRFHRSEFGLEEHKVREGKFHELLQQLTPNHDAIVTDLARTYPHIPFFEKSIAQGGLGQMALFNVLKAYTLADPEVGYCQGFGFIAGVLLLHMDEETAFEMFHAILVEYGHRQFCQKDIDLKLQFFKLNRLLLDVKPNLLQLFDAINLDEEIYATSWLLTLFGEQYPVAFNSRFLDFYLFYGPNAVFNVILALLELHEERLLECNSLEEAAGVLRAPLSEHKMERVFSVAFERDLERQLAGYEVEFLSYKKEYLFNVLFGITAHQSLSLRSREEHLVPMNVFKEALMKQFNQKDLEGQRVLALHQAAMLKKRVFEDVLLLKQFGDRAEEKKKSSGGFS